MEIALISFDGLDPRVLYDNRDKLSAFDELMHYSMHGKWKTPGHTLPSYLATLSGRKYESTNFHWAEGRGKYQRHRQTEYEYIWETLDASMTLLNLPVLYPPENIEDAMVCGFLTPDSMVEDNLARPKEVQDKLNEMDYIHDVYAEKTYDELGGEGMLEYLKMMMNRRLDASNYLINKYDSDLFYGVWSAPDRWFHQCNLYGENPMPMYEYADNILSVVMEYIPDDIPLIVFSDHGFAHFEGDEGVHNGHLYDGFYSVKSNNVPHYRDDSANIFDLYPTVCNYLSGEVPNWCRGRVLFNKDDQDAEVRDRLSSLGYLDDK